MILGGLSPSLIVRYQVNIFDAIDDLKKDTTYQSIRLSQRSSVRGMGKQQQVKRIQDYVFMVKGD